MHEDVIVYFYVNEEGVIAAVSNTYEDITDYVRFEEEYGRGRGTIYQNQIELIWEG